MSEIGLDINVDSYNNEGIKTIKGNNNAEIYKLYILKNKIRLNLVGKTVKLGYVMAGTTKGDIIEDLNITNAEQGEITFPITNRISKQDGVYSCQLAIYGADEFLEYTATFGLTVEDNIFTKIAGEIENSKDLTYIERILDEATNISEELKSNIPVARQLNSDLENQNRILNENMDRANGVNNTLITTTEQSKVAATDAIEKKSQLESSITKAKEFIDGLDGSQDIPGMRMELTELQNGLKSNQSLEYSGSSITANDTLEGRTEGMKIKGRTLNNIYKANNIREDTGGKYILVDTLVKDEPKDRVVYIVNNTNRILLLNVYRIGGGWDSNPIIRENSISKLDLTGKKLTGFLGMYDRGWTNSEADKELLRNTCIVLDREESYIPQKYFEGLKSFGESEREDDKYKISILSNGKNLFDFTKYKEKIKSIQGVVIKEDGFIADCDNSGAVGNNLLKTTQILKGYFKPNCQYFFDYKVVQEGRFNGGFIYNYTDGTTSSCKFASQVGKTINYIGFTFGTQAYGGKTIFSEIMLIEGSNKPIYEPYQSDKKDILIKEPLRSVNDVKDVMYEDNGQVKVNRKVGKYTFTGDEGWTLGTQSSGWGEFDDTLVFYLDPFKAKTNTRFICDKFAYKNVVNINEVGIYNNVWGNKPHPVIRIKKSELSTPDLEGFKAWLKTNPTTMIYQLTEPTIEIVENCVDIDLDTYQEKTYFNILNSLPGTLDFKVPSNIGSLVQSNAKEINNINEFINNFILKALLEMNKDLAAIKIKNGLN
ncbi:BppU family phage baseplate upper protein [Clostridium perfringens]|nr:BppU family phage baseplate upper protein [Clostridium perfringens]